MWCRRSALCLFGMARIGKALDNPRQPTRPRRHPCNNAKLDAVLSKGADPKLIDTYETERKPHAKEMIGISAKMKDFVSIANPFLAGLRNVAIRTLMMMP